MSSQENEYNINSFEENGHGLKKRERDKSFENDLPYMAEQNFQNQNFYPNQSNSRNNREFHQVQNSQRISRRKGKPLKLDYSNSEEEESFQDSEEEPQNEPIFLQPIESIHSMSEENDQKKFYVKFKGKSFRHCKWMLEEEIMEYDPQIKNKLNRFVRDFDYNVAKRNNFYLNYDSSFLEIDRVLDCTEIFPVLHPKKGSQIKKKWTHGLIKVLNFLANFEYQNIFYGVLFLKISGDFAAFPEIKNNIDFGVLMNRVFLDFYDGVIPFWNDILTLFQNYQILNYQRENNDQAIILYRMKQIAKFAFQEWKKVHEEEYQKLNDFFQLKLSEVSFSEFTRDFNSIFQIKTKSGGFQEELENFIKKYQDFILNQEEINLILIQMKQKRKEIEQIQQDQGELTETKSIEEEKQKEEFKNLLSNLQLQLNQNIEHFQYLFDQSKLQNLNQIFTKEINSLEFFNDEIDLSWIEEEDLKQELSIQKPNGKKYLVKWKQLSYVQCTWEEENFVKNFLEQINDFKRFNRALMKDQRQEYLNRYSNHNELREIFSNQRKFSRQHPTHIHDLKKKVFGFKDPKEIKQYQQNNPPQYKENKYLRSYQLDGLNWMIKSWTKRTNIILADEMGLGKTIQAMSFLNHLVKQEKLNGPFLIIAPLSTLQHWKRVFEEWSDLNTVLYYDGQGKQGREMCRKLEWYRNDVTQNGSLTQTYKIGKFHALITSFEVFLQDMENVFQEIPFQHIIIDEAHRLKNKNAKIIKELKKLVCTRIFLLTGTPIQNNLTELWSLLNFIEPNNFTHLSDFEADYSKLNNENLEKLKEKLEPYLLRRMKEEVENSIPPLQETIIDIELTNIQKMVYKTIYEKNKGTLQKGLGLKFVSMMNNLEMQLRKCCNHPFLLQGIRENIIPDPCTIVQYHEKMLSSSGKMIFLHKMIQKFKVENKKILIFSQFTEMLKVIEEYLNYEKIRFEKIDGSTKAKDRQRAIDRFNKRAEFFEVFLLSTKAGGIGINLTSAKIVIIYDSDWNPQNDVQAIARAHRIGQTEEVKVFRLVSKKTYETEMFERATKKRGLDQAIFLSGDFSQLKNNEYNEKDEMKKLKPEEIELLLKKGMLGLLEQQTENDNEIFEQDINKVIEKARVANYSFVNGNYSFAKGNFQSSAENKVLLDDPDFWKKVFKDQDNPTQKLLKEFDEKVNDKTFKLLNVQKDFVLKVAFEVHHFLVNRVKDDFHPDMENFYEDLFQKIQDYPDVKSQADDVINQLKKDLKKKSRRIKLIDEKFFKNMKRKPGDSAKKTKKPSEQEEDGVFNSDPDFLEPKDEKKSKKSFCSICKNEKPTIKCQKVCQNNYHTKCFTKLIKDNQKQILDIKNGDKITQDNDLQLIVDGECYLCIHKKAQCFCCKKFDLITEDGKINPLDEENQQNYVYKCNECPIFYHLNCLKNLNTEIVDGFVCPLHFCGHCKEKGNENLFECSECPVAYHKKCLSKKNKIIKNFVIICQNHKKKLVKRRKDKKEEKIEKTEENDKKQKNSKQEKEKQKKPKKKKSDLLQYDHFDIEEPSQVDYKSLTKPWCIYCGARYSKKFYESPFGPETLCDIHFKILRKSQLKLPETKPEVPVRIEKNTELLFLNKNLQQQIQFKLIYLIFLLSFES